MSKILLIEDDATMGSMLSQLLSRNGYEITHVEDGEKGIAELKENQFDLIITDIVMPEKEGLETITEIRKSLKKMPIIAMSGGGKNPADTYLEFAKTLGADTTFTKPFDTKEFLHAIEKCLRSNKES